MSNRTNPYYEVRAFATRYKIATAIVAGIVATHVATMTGYWNHGVGLPVLDWNTTNGLQLLPDASHNTQFFSGAAAHYTTGVCFALLYACGPHMFIPLRNTILGNIGKAMLFGTLLALVSATIMIPLVFYPQLDPGFFSHHLGFKFVLSIFVWHWVYGLHLGAIYNPLPDEEVIQSQSDLARAASNGHAASAALARAGDDAVPAGAVS
jgi:hypothetical protein